MLYGESVVPSLRWYVFTGLSAIPTHSVGPIFRCTTKDRGERRASSSQAPHPSFCLSGQKLSRSAAPPLPTKPTSLGFGGAPIGGPLNPRSNVLGHSDVLCANRSATVHLTRLRRLRRCRLSPCLCVLRCQGHGSAYDFTGHRSTHESVEAVRSTPRTGLNRVNCTNANS